MHVFKRIFALPTWLITRMTLIFLPEDHPLSKKDPGLTDWTQNRTWTALFFDVFFWSWILMMVIIVFSMS